VHSALIGGILTKPEQQKSIAKQSGKCLNSPAEVLQALIEGGSALIDYIYIDIVTLSVQKASSLWTKIYCSIWWHGIETRKALRSVRMYK
jgi:hypothetical protein